MSPGLPYVVVMTVSVIARRASDLNTPTLPAYFELALLGDQAAVVTTCVDILSARGGGGSGTMQFVDRRRARGRGAGAFAAPERSCSGRWRSSGCWRSPRPRARSCAADGFYLLGDAASDEAGDDAIGVLHAMFSAHPRHHRRPGAAGDGRGPPSWSGGGVSRPAWSAVERGGPGDRCSWVFAACGTASSLHARRGRPAGRGAGDPHFVNEFCSPPLARSSASRASRSLLLFLLPTALARRSWSR